ncbi:MAG TPA: V-type ATP synthase subunit D [Draconibacterium sp.]|nr:V-type ATP synthase subunit D [Draconibacterium sp.]
MSIKFQYNKTSLQSLNKQLNMRLKALPTLKNKEAALRVEVKKAKDKSNELEKMLNKKLKSHAVSAGLWHEFMPELISVGEVKLTAKKIAGVKIPVFEEVVFHEATFSLFETPKWFPKGISIVQELAETLIEKEFFTRKMQLLDFARRKTTQKVNLYEKVQIPGYENAILKIKRFLEDEENLSKSAQKIVKKRQQKQLEEAQ